MWEPLTKHGVTEAEAIEIYSKHYRLAMREAEYQAVLRSIQEAKDLAYSRMSVLQKLLYRWQWMVRHYG
jgi:hypothetical protein